MQEFDPTAQRTAAWRIGGRRAGGTATANGSAAADEALMASPSEGPLGTEPRLEGDTLSAHDAVLDEHDTPAEVDAAFRTQRRVAIGYAVLFALVTIAVPTLGLGVDWWSSGRLLGGLSPSFAMVAVGLYVVFFLLAFASAMLAGSVEDRMLGGPDRSFLDDDEESAEEDCP